MLLILFRLVGGKTASAEDRRGWSRAGTMAFFFALTLGGWLLFRVNQLSDVPRLLANMFHPWVWTADRAVWSILLFAGPLLLLEAMQEQRGDMLAIKRLAWPARYAIYAFLTFAILAAGARETYAFIYFQF